MKKRKVRGIIILFLISVLCLSVYSSNTVNFLIKFSNPEVQKAYETAICVSSPTICISGKVSGKVTGEILQKVAKEAPEFTKAINTYNQIQEYGSVMEELTMKTTGVIERGEFNIGKSDSQIPIEVKGGIKLEPNGDFTTFTFEGSNSYIKIGESEFKNIQKGGKITIDKTGEVSNAEFITQNDGGIYKLGDNTLRINKPGVKVSYSKVKGKEEFKIESRGNEFSFNNQKIKSMDRIWISGNKLSGSNIELIHPKLGRFYIQEGYNIQMEDSYYKFNSGSKVFWDSQKLEFTPLGKSLTVRIGNCNAISQNTLAVCDTLLSVDGNLNLRFHEGNKILPIKTKNTLLRYDIKESKIKTWEDKVFIQTRKGGSVTEWNDGNKLTYKNGRAVAQVGEFLKKPKSEEIYDGSDIISFYEGKEYHYITKGGIQIYTNGQTSNVLAIQKGMTNYEDITYGTLKLGNPIFNNPKGYCAASVREVLGGEQLREIGIQGDVPQKWDDTKKRYKPSSFVQNILHGRKLEEATISELKAKKGDLIMFERINPSDPKGPQIRHVAVVLGRNQQGEILMYHQFGRTQYIQTLKDFEEMTKNYKNGYYKKAMILRPAYPNGKIPSNSPLEESIKTGIFLNHEKRQEWAGRNPV